MYSLRKMIDTVLPPRCPFSGEIVDEPGTLSPSAWGALSFIAAPHCSACGFPFEFSVPAGSADNLCGTCLADRPEFDKARSALVYNDASRDFILGFKHGDQTHAVTAMVPWLRQAGAELWNETDIVVPVPLHRWRLLRRRYNQAALIGAAMGKTMAKPFVADALTRSRATPSQGHLTAKDRRSNVRLAFAVPDKRRAHISGKTVMLVDDVYTTGSTVRECSRILLEAGAARVFVLTVARVVRAGKVD